MDRPRSTQSPLDGLGSDVAHAFWGYNLLYYAGAIGATGAIAWSGADQAVHERFNHNRGNKGWTNVANIAGYVVPAVTSPTLWIVGLATHDRELTGAGAAAIQAVGVTLATTGALKIATGRPYPLEDDGLDPAAAHEFRPFKNGLGAWPSGHTAATISIAAALTSYYDDAGKWWIAAIGYPLAIGMGVGMMDRDSHWTSDIVAGAVIGHAIGFSIGRDFRRRMRGERTPRGLEVGPFAGAPGVAVRGVW